MSAQSLLHENVSSFFSAFQNKHGQHMACREGCSRCCHTHISVFVSEAAEIGAWFNAQSADTQATLRQHWCEPQKSGVDAAGKQQPPCVFLHNNRCTIYEVRPTICRSQGLPLMFREENLKAQETTIHVDFCPLNFTEPNALPPQAEWLDLDRLNTLQSLASQQQTPLFAKLATLADANNRIELAKLRDWLLK
jgi:Fe-S-cluster containining protein